MAKAKKVTKKKAAPKKKVVSKKKNISVAKSAKKRKSVSRGIEIPPANLTDIVVPASLVTEPIINISADQLIIELCAPGKRCKQKTNGSFIRQNFISGRWVQVSGTTFPSLEACKKACGG